jgi:hypothetical protein
MRVRGVDCGTALNVGSMQMYTPRCQDAGEPSTNITWVWLHSGRRAVTGALVMSTQLYIQAQLTMMLRSCPVPNSREVAMLRTIMLLECIF